MQVYFDITALFDNVGQGILWGWLVSPSLLTRAGVGFGAGLEKQ